MIFTLSMRSSAHGHVAPCGIRALTGLAGCALKEYDGKTRIQEVSGSFSLLNDDKQQPGQPA